MKVGFVLTSLALTAAVAAGTAPAPAADHPAVGRWDITITQGDLQVPSWIEIRPHAGKLAARFCSEVRGVYDAGEVKVAGNEVTFKSIDQRAYPDHWYTYNGTLKGDTMSGTRSDGHDRKHTWVARRFVPKVNVAGKWTLTYTGGDGKDEAVLVLRQKNGQVDGTFQETKDGPELIVANARLDGEALTFEVGIARTPTFRTKAFKARVKGDVLEGTAKDTPGQSASFTARREREWGEPIHVFNGKNLDGWKPLRDPSGRASESKWTVIDGIMTCTGRSPNIVSERKFMDFKIHVEFRVPEHGNSGVYLRGRYEIQVADSFGQPVSSSSCGGMYSRITPTVNASKPTNEWQTFDATLIGQYITLKLNGVTIADNRELEGITGGAIDSHESQPGPIYLQGDHGKIEYRKIIVTPARKPLASLPGTCRGVMNAAPDLRGVVLSLIQ